MENPAAAVLEFSAASAFHQVFGELPLKSWSCTGSVVAALSLLTGTASQAQTTTWTFAGVVQSGPDAGQLVSGSMSFDLSMIPVTGGNGQSSASGGMSYPSPQPSPPPVSAVVTVGSTTVVVGGGRELDDVTVMVNKGRFTLPAASYFDGYFLQAASLSAGGVNPYLVVQTFQYTDGVNASGIFTNTGYDNPDLSLGQSVNWLAPGATSTGGLQSSTGDYWSFTLTSMAVSSVPEPATFATLALGLACLSRLRSNRSGGASGW